MVYNTYTRGGQKTKTSSVSFSFSFYFSELTQNLEAAAAAQHVHLPPFLGGGIHLADLNFGFATLRRLLDLLCFLRFRHSLHNFHVRHFVCECVCA